MLRCNLGRDVGRILEGAIGAIGFLPPSGAAPVTPALKPRPLRAMLARAGQPPL
jgi:hypothetical protein